MSLLRYSLSSQHTFLVALLLTASSTPAARLRADEAPVVHGEARPQADDDLGLSIGVRVENGNHRSFRQFEPTTGEVRTYNARVYGGIGLSLQYERSFAEHLFSWSLSADYWRSLLFTSGARRLGRTVETSAQRACALAGLAVHPAATTGSASVGLLAGIDARGFDFSMPPAQSADDEAMQLATGNYALLSTGIVGRVPLSPLSLSIRGSYLLGLHTGAFGSRQVDGQPQGLEALAGVEYRILPWLDVFAGAGVTLLWFQLAPVDARPSDQPAGVRDLYLALGMGARARL